MAFPSRFGVRWLAAGLCFLAPASALAYLNNGRWNSTATDFVTNPNGRPITLTWSIVPDGTNISHLGKPSNLISVFDSIFPGSTGLPLAQKPWFALIQQSFNRWNEVSGVTYVYEPTDDGVAHGTAAGLLGARGDIRLGGASIDGTGGTNNTLATASLIPNADITIDTADTAYFGALGGFAPYINLRTTLMHEIGHTLGLGHSSSNNATFLMEGVLPAQIAFDGPQIDDIRGAHYLYGDAYEKANAGAGNNTFAHATSLGTIGAAQSVLLGQAGGPDTVVLASETDFLSISSASDVDIFSFSISHPSVVDLVLTPLGATYHERGTINTSAVSDLKLELYVASETTPQLLQSVNLNGVGQAESLLDLSLAVAGTYYARISGSANAVQLYQLLVDVNQYFIPGDFNNDGVVDAADFTRWRDHLGDASESAISNRGDGLNGVDLDDFEIWKSHFGDTLEVGGAAAQSVPEPAAIASLFSLLVAAIGYCRKVNILPRDLRPPCREFVDRLPSCYLYSGAGNGVAIGHPVVAPQAGFASVERIPNAYCSESQL